MKNMSFHDRTYAALFVVGSNVRDGVSVKQVADALEVSKVYASRLIRYWVKSGFVTEYSVPYRKNTAKAMFTMTDEQWIRYQVKGYSGIARSHFTQNLRHNYYKFVSKLDSVMTPINTGA